MTSFKKETSMNHNIQAYIKPYRYIVVYYTCHVHIYTLHRHAHITYTYTYTFKFSHELTHAYLYIQSSLFMQHIYIRNMYLILKF